MFYCASGMILASASLINCKMCFDNEIFYHPAVLSFCRYSCSDFMIPMFAT